MMRRRAPGASPPAPSDVTAAMSPISPAAPPRPRSSVSTVVFAIVAIGAAVAGILVGREIALEQSRRLLFAGAIPMFLLAIVVVGLGLVGLVGLGVRRGRLNLAIGTAFAASGLLAAGAVVGWATAAATGGTERAPVILQAAGTATLTMAADPGTFAAGDGGAATCELEQDGRGVAMVTALDLGQLASGTLRARVSLSTDEPDAGRVEFWIDGADLPEGADQPFWLGSAEITWNDRAGRATFTDVRRESDPATGPGSGAASISADGWPATFSGTLGWICEPW